ncbi:hypothetical protein Trydic_g22847 [Trypoxylus dichotomus]
MYNFGWLRTASEVPSFILFFAFTITETTTYNFAMFRSCYVDFGYNKSNCELLGTGNSDNYTKAIEEEIQPYANVLLMVQEMITQVAPAVIVLFLGPWSDKHGRRPVLIINMIGFCLGGIFAIVVSSVESLSAWYFTGCSLLIALFGGITPFLTAIICYISDITTEKNRGFRMGIFEGIMSAGMLLGTLLTSYIFDLGGYITIYSLATACFFLAFFFNIFVMVESRQFAKDRRETMTLCTSKNFKELLRTIFRKRENNLTLVIILVIITSTIIRFISHADVSIFYLFLRKTLDWDMEKYTVYKTLRDLLRIIVTVAAISFLHKGLRIKEAPLILASAALTFASMLLQAWASTDWHIYLAGVIRSLGGVLAPMVRSLLSKMVTQEETGKLFSITVALESLVLLGGIPLYTFVYNHTLETNPGAFNFVTGALYFLLVIFIGIVLLVQKFMVKENVLRASKTDPLKGDKTTDADIECVPENPVSENSTRCCRTEEKIKPACCTIFGMKDEQIGYRTRSDQKSDSDLKEDIEVPENHFRKAVNDLIRSTVKKVLMTGVERKTPMRQYNYTRTTGTFGPGGLRCSFNKNGYIYRLCRTPARDPVLIEIGAAREKQPTPRANLDPMVCNFLGNQVMLNVTPPSGGRFRLVIPNLDKVDTETRVNVHGNITFFLNDKDTNIVFLLKQINPWRQTPLFAMMAATKKTLLEFK